MKSKTPKKLKRTNAKAKPGDKRLGNQFWKVRSRHGREAIFTEPQVLWESAVEYFQWCDENPFQEQDYRNGQYVYIDKLRPYTMEGLCLFLHVNTVYFRTFKKSLTMEQKEFHTVIDQIEETIRNQQISGAQAGFLNQNIVARLNGLVDKQENKVTGTQTIIQQVSIERTVVKKQ